MNADDRVVEPAHIHDRINEGRHTPLAETIASADVTRYSRRRELEIINRESERDHDCRCSN